MGAIVSLNREGYPDLWIQGQGCTCDGLSALSFPFDDRPSEIPPGDLWDRFGREVDEHLVEINKNLCCRMIVSILLIQVCAAAVIVTFLILQNQWVLLPVALTAIVAILVCVDLSRISDRHEGHDRAIRRICSSYQTDFVVRAGRFPEYRTRHTNLLRKQKRARTQRVIVFPRGPPRATATTTRTATVHSQAIATPVCEETAASTDATRAGPRNKPKPRGKAKRDGRPKNQRS